MNTKTLSDSIEAAYETRVAACGRTAPKSGKIADVNLDAARHAASTVLSPIMEPTGVWGWLVRPMRGETIRAYARRASRCAAARCAEAGYPAPAEVAHDGAETVGMVAGHGPRPTSAVKAVSRIERAIADE